MISTAPLPRSTASYQSFSMMGVRVTPKVLAHETNGQFSMTEQVAEPGAGSPPHICNNETKIFYVASGEFEFLMGTITRRAATGDTITIPAGAIHRYENVGATPGTLFVTFTPGGHEEFLRELSELYQDEDVRPEDIDRLCQHHDVEIIP
ncbi:hypothetical protein BH23CHL2_BH23CHL2_27760 [soil metagenome]